MQPYVQEFMDFVRRSPTAFHACSQAANMLEEAGFERLHEHGPFAVRPGGKYYVTRNQSAVIAFRVPQAGLSPFRIVASHADSPTLKLKPLPLDDGSRYVRLNVEQYGGAILSTWLDRPLSVAGRLIVRTENGLESRLCSLDRDAVLIPNLPIHMNRNVNEGFAFNVQTDLMPLWGDKGTADGLMRALCESVGARTEDVAGHDLFLYSRVPGSVWGAGEEYFSCGRIDDLECAWTSLTAFLSQQASDHVSVFALFDNEEVGSLSQQGADSTLLSDVLFRLGEGLGQSAGAVRAAIAGSFMVSADNAHALHPNHPEKYDAQNRVYMNGGVVIKFSASQKYTSDGVSMALFSELCRQADVPVQYFANRSDQRGGSTLGNLSNAHVSLSTVDIGLAQLAMHSSYETAGVQDLGYMIRALSRFYSARFSRTADGCWALEADA